MIYVLFSDESGILYACRCVEMSEDFFDYYDL